MTADLVREFLRGQNFEQVGRVEEAIDVYEAVIGSRFDSAGPYDRLISLYADRSRHLDVVRVAEAAIANVHTYKDKIGWYERMRREALDAQGRVPRAVPKAVPKPSR